MDIVGDLHGDLEQTRRALEMAGVLSWDGQDLWTGGETVITFDLTNCMKFKVLSPHPSKLQK